MKFNKRYRLTVQVDDAGNSVEIDYPLTCEFNIIRTIFSGANTGKFTIYNLGEDTRNKIFHDLYDPKTIRKLTFQAGYADQNPLPIAFQGRVQVAYSTRKGVNWVGRQRTAGKFASIAPPAVEPGLFQMGSL